MIYRILIVLALLLFPTEALSSFSVQPTIGTLGTGAELGWRYGDTWGLRIGAAVYPFENSIKLKGIKYKADNSSYNVSLLADVYPFENGLRFTAGAYYFKMKAKITTSIDAVNPLYEELINQSKGTALWQRVAPYAGLGWQSDAKESGLGWHFSLGALYMGKAHVSFQLPDVYIPQRYVSRIEKKKESIRDCAHGGFYMAFLNEIKKYGVRFTLWLCRRAGVLRWMRRTDREWKDLL